MCFLTDLYVFIFYLSFVASVNSLLDGNPFDDININNIGVSYTGIFSTSLTLTQVSS